MFCFATKNRIINTQDAYVKLRSIAFNKISHTHHPKRSSKSILYIRTTKINLQLVVFSKQQNVKRVGSCQLNPSTNPYTEPKTYDHKLPVSWPNLLKLMNDHQNHLKDSEPHATPSNKKITLFFL